MLALRDTKHHRSSQMPNCDSGHSRRACAATPGLRARLRGLFLGNRERAISEAAPAHSPNRPPIDCTLWVAGWGSGPVPPCAERSISRSEEHTSELQSLMRSSYAAFCLKKTTTQET